MIHCKIGQFLIFTVVKNPKSGQCDSYDFIWSDPLELVADKIADRNVTTTAKAVEKIGERVAVAGVGQTYLRSGTFKRELMMFLTLEDLTGTADVIVFPDVYRQTRTILDATIPTVIVGVMEMDATRTELVLRAEKVMRIA